MGVVTKLEIQKRRKDRVNVFIDDEYALSLSLDEAARLSKGQTLTDTETADLMERSSVGLAVDHGLRLLSLRPRSAWEIRQHLSRSEVADPVIDRAVERLIALGYLDDQAFAAFWVQERMRFKPASPKALRYELRQKGVENVVIDSALAELDADEAAYQAVTAQVRKLRNLSRREFQDKATTLLLRRGFTFSQARTAIRRWIDEQDAQTPDFFADDDSAGIYNHDE